MWAAAGQPQASRQDNQQADRGDASQAGKDRHAEIREVPVSTPGKQVAEQTGRRAGRGRQKSR